VVSLGTFWEAFLEWKGLCDATRREAKGWEGRRWVLVRPRADGGLDSTRESQGVATYKSVRSCAISFCFATGKSKAKRVWQDGGQDDKLARLRR
jgi:hypothetical protein